MHSDLDSDDPSDNDDAMPELDAELDAEPTAMTDESWWVARIGDTLVWARMRTFESGIARVFDCDGNDVPFDSEDSARAALLDAEYRRFDGLDEDDAAALGFHLEALEPPLADNDEDLREQMFQKLLPR
jgi:hypothetical protein